PHQVGLEGAGQGLRGHHPPLAAGRDRGDEDEGSERQRYRRGDQDHRRKRPRDGPPGRGGLRVMAKLSKKQKTQAGSVDRDRFYPVDEALGLVKQNATAKFDETVEVALNLGVDPRHADQMVRGVVNLPKGTGKSVRVAECTKEDSDATTCQAETRAEKAGTDQARIGKADFAHADLKANFEACMHAIGKAKPSGAKGKFVKKVSVSSSKRPGLKIDFEEVA